MNILKFCLGLLFLALLSFVQIASADSCFTIEKPVLGKFKGGPPVIDDFGCIKSQGFRFCEALLQCGKLLRKY
jgi:hypothetical protein